MKKICLFLLLLASNRLFAQTPTIPPAGVEITKAIPPSADAAALGKYGRIPIGTFTGIPNISIPLYTVKSGDLSLPVSLNYHSGGIKVEEVASSVGLGWTLNAGGVITRTVRGIADEELNGYLDPAQNVKNINNALTGHSSTLTPDAAAKLLNRFADGTYDGESDIYNFNFAGYSGQFSFDENGGIIISPRQDISFTFPYSEGNPITSFIATTPDGVKYYFGSSNGDAVEYTQRNNQANKSYATSWFLKKIISPSGAEIDFTYKPEYYTQTQPGGTMYRFLNSVGTPTPRPDDNSGSSNSLHTMKLTGITFENGNIQVYSNLSRLDINSNNLSTGARMIDTIAIASTGFSKLYRFCYTNKTTTRLRLDSLIGQLDPISGTNNFKKEKYIFSYNPDPYSTNSSFRYAQDWWGYYNGYNQTTLVPWAYDPLNLTQKLPGAERSPDAGQMGGGMLTRIQYPTKGYTVFNYEPNQTPNYDFGANSYVPDPQVTAFSNDNQNVYYNYDSRNGNPNHLIHIYSTVNPLPQMALHITATGLEYGNNPPPFDYVTAHVYKKDASGNYTIDVYNIMDTDTTIYLDQGFYAIKLLDNKGQTDTTRANYIKYSIAALWSNHLSPNGGHYHGFTASGLRIAKIEDYDGINANPFNVRTYKYNLNDTTSSGYLNFQPQYSYNLQIYGGTIFSLTTTNYFVRTANSNYPLATQQGAVVGYFHVEEDLDNNGQKGKNDYYYSISGAEGAIGPGFPFAPATTMEWHEGLLVSQVTSKYTGSGNYAPIQKKVNVYSSINTGSGLSIKAGFNPYPLSYSPVINYLGGGGPTDYGTLIEQPYTNATDYTYLSSDTTYVYDGLDATKFIRTWNNYQMDPVTYQLTRLQSINSKNELTTQSVTYPGSASLSVRGVSNLFGLNIFTYPIEEVTTKSAADGSNSRTVKAVLTSYKTNKPFRDTVFEVRSVTPLTNFVSLASGGQKDTRYKPIVSFEKYDANGSIMQERKVGDAYHNYIWGYKNPNPPFNNTYPIAEVLNADSASIAYTNFESYNTNGLGNWVYTTAGNSTDATAPMGSLCYTVSSTNTLVKSGLSSAASYVVSFWYKSGAAITVTGGTVSSIATGNAKSNWIYREYQVTGTTSVTIAGTGLVDEVRLYPVTAQMSTYTYIPLVGMSGKCDTKNNITYYLFDNVGRLIQVQDQNRNIVKDYQYNYVNTDPLWVDVSPVTLLCVKNVNGDNTGEQQKLQIDNNAASPTYQHTRWLSMGIVPGSCPVTAVTLYVKMILANTYVSGGDTFNTYEFDVYRDAACTQPYIVLSDLLVNYDLVITTRTNGVVTNTTTGHNNVLIAAGNQNASIGPIDMTACITCNVGGGGGGGGGAAAIQSPQTLSSGGVQTQSGTGGGGTGCSSTVTLKTGTGYTPEF